MPAKATKEPDLVQLQTDVALLKQFNEKFVEPSLKRIDAKLDSLSYVTVDDFEEHKSDVNRRFKELAKKTWLQNTLSAIAGAVLTLLATYFVKDLLNK